MALLKVENLSVEFQTNDGAVQAVKDLSFELEKGHSLAIVGESGSGKSQTAFSIMGLLAENGRSSGRVLIEGKDILNLPISELNTYRAEKMAMIFQDPMTSLNPYLRVSEQMVEVLIHHRGMSKREATARAIAMLDAVRIPEAKNRVHMYPHEFSGGMRQRVMIAMALLCEPELLIADEPTTALDVTVQDQIMSLLGDLQKEFQMSLVLITHDLGVVAQSCEKVLVLYGGQMMEYDDIKPLFARPGHPYTQALLSAIPRLDQGNDALNAIPGNPPNMMNMPKGCPFSPRCEYVVDHCRTDRAIVVPSGSGLRACHKPKEELV
ncbi:MAG: ATP-binding cassette domain-containing protein [Marinovum sp.]|nr:ATP-binding cassette domain-containing protein [Marinovum sp.]MBT6097925.1 ATP-binding cassette domain-containing protein [Marinovum sp.]MBT6507115.1 ATP-binding cassette domain-containing protein [Marinovum sp.]MBT7907811.1 ATP-binding cassette domain-containing protein [Marinovum sp.]